MSDYEATAYLSLEKLKVSDILQDWSVVEVYSTATRIRYLSLGTIRPYQHFPQV